MMKKLSSIIAILLFVIAGGWFYLANKFEKIVAEEILPKLQKEDSLVSVDMDAIIIEKFKFKLMLQDVVIFPNSKLFKINANEIIACYNPITDHIKTHFSGDKLTVGEGSTEFYFPSPNHVIGFNRSLLKKDFENFDINITSKDSSIYFAKDDKFISKSDQSKLSISNSLSNDMYDMNFSFNIDSMQINPKSQFFTKIITSLVPEFENNSINTNIDSYYYKMLEETGSLDYQTNYSIQLGKDHVYNLIAVLKREKEFTEALENFSFTQDTYSINGNETLKNPAIKDTGSITLTGDGEKITGKADIEMNRSYGEDQKENIIQISNSLLIEALKLLNTKNSSRIDDKLQEEDFTKLSELLTEIDKVGIKLDVEYDIKSNNLEQEIKLTLNDLKIESEGEVKDKIYNGKFKVSNPKILTDGIPQIYKSGVREIFLKLSSNDQGNFDISSYDQIAENIINNGFNALAAFHKDDELKEDDELISELSFNPNSFEFKINDKGFFEILTDERIVNFLKDMPDENTEEDK